MFQLSEGEDGETQSGNAKFPIEEEKSSFGSKTFCMSELLARPAPENRPKKYKFKHDLMQADFWVMKVETG